MIIRGFDKSDTAQVRALISQAFGQPQEAALCEALRRDGDMALELVAEHKKKIVGHVALSHMVSPSGWLALAPLCTDPKMQNRGIGTALGHMALDYANAPVVVLGDRGFYTRIGFDFERSANLATAYEVQHTGLYAPDLADPRPALKLDYAKAFSA